MSFIVLLLLLMLLLLLLLLFSFPQGVLTFHGSQGDLLAVLSCPDNLAYGKRSSEGLTWAQGLGLSALNKPYVL